MFNIAIVIIAIIIKIAVIFYFWNRKQFNFWNERGFTSVGGSLPFGSMRGMTFKYMLGEILDQYYKEFKNKTSVLGLYKFTSPVLLVLDPKLIKNILIRDFQAFDDRGFFHNKKTDPIGTNLFTMRGEEWKERRSKVSPMFSLSKIKQMFEIQDGNSNRLVEAIKNSLSDSSVQEMKTWSQRYTMDNIGMAAFGIDMHCIDDINAEFLKYGNRFFNCSTSESLKFKFSSEYNEIAKKLGMGFLPGVCGEFYHKTFLEIFDQRESTKSNRRDFLSMLLGLKDNYTQTELAAEAFVICNAGFKTSSVLMMFVMYELSLNQDIQDRLRQEVLETFEANDMQWTYDIVSSMNYLDMVINETLRKYPPVTTIYRKSVVDYEIPETKLVIPKETSVFINCLSLQHDPEYFPNPQKFDPERFSAENVGNIPPYTFFPFGEGPRFCLGMSFGMMQSKIGIANLIRNFIFEPSSHTTVPIKLIPSSPFVLEPVGGMKLNVKSL